MHKPHDLSDIRNGFLWVPPPCNTFGRHGMKSCTLVAGAKAFVLVPWSHLEVNPKITEEISIYTVCTHIYKQNRLNSIPFFAMFSVCVAALSFRIILTWKKSKIKKTRLQPSIKKTTSDYCCLARTRRDWSIPECLQLYMIKMTLFCFKIYI